MALYLALRTGRDMIVRPRSVTFDVIALFLLYTAAQGAASALLTRLFPGGL
jgi:cytochrome c oxidase subunit I+III